MSQNESLRPQLNRLQSLALIVGALGLALCAVGWYLDPGQFFHSYLFAYMFWLGLALGSFGIAHLHQLTGGAWGYGIRRILETAAMMLPLMLVLFAPIALDALGVFGPSHLYEWAHTDIVAGDPILASKSAYLNAPFFLLRAAIYFAIWIGIAALLNRWSLEHDRTGDEAAADRLRLLARIGLVLYILTLTFASVDWVMSLEPHWFSSIFGVLFLAGQGLSSLAFAIVVGALLSTREPLGDVLTVDRFNDLGNLLLAFVMFWAYITLSQYLIIWSGNLPEEVTWYLHRTQGGWNWIILFVLLFQFALPFLLLLSRRTKRRVRALAAVAGMIIVVHLFEMFWRVMPSLHQEGLAFHWLDLAAPIGIGGIWVAAFIWLLKSRPLVPRYYLRDAHPQGALEHG